MSMNAVHNILIWDRGIRQPWYCGYVGTILSADEKTVCVLQSKFGIARGTRFTVAAASPGDRSPPAIVCSDSDASQCVDTLARWSFHQPDGLHHIDMLHEITGPGQYSMIFAPILDTFGRASRLASLPSDWHDLGAPCRTCWPLELIRR